MCPLLSRAWPGPGRLTLSVSSLSRRKYLLDQGYLIKGRTKNSIPDCISFHIYGSGQDRQNGLLNSHMIPTRDKRKKYRRKLCFRNLLTTWWFDGCRLSGDCNERDCRSLGMILGRIMSCETWHTRLSSWYQCLDRAPSLMIMSVGETSGCNETKNIVNSGVFKPATNQVPVFNYFSSITTVQNGNWWLNNFTPNEIKLYSPLYLDGNNCIEA